jgi:thiamine pyrophosphate-dependent acetolactate synthase large subunit-like protein
VLADALRPYSAELAAHYADVEIPAAVEEPWTFAGSTSFITIGSGETFSPDLLADASARVALLVGPRALKDTAGIHRVAHELGAPVANTWGAKGIYPWNDGHHMGTCGLQRDDFVLLGLGEFDLVIAVGLDDAECRPSVPPDIRLVYFRGDLMRLPVPGAPRPLVPAGLNELFRRISAIAQPGYVDEAVPRHPARAVMDLKQSLGPATRVTAQPGDVGLWIARTFPTDRLGSIAVPAHDRPGIGAAVGLASAARNTETVTVARDPVDDETHAILELAARHDLPLRLEVWGDDVDWSRTDDLIAAAGPVVAWTA